MQFDVSLHPWSGSRKKWPGKPYQHSPSLLFHNHLVSKVHDDDNPRSQEIHGKAWSHSLQFIVIRVSESLPILETRTGLLPCNFTNFTIWWIRWGDSSSYVLWPVLKTQHLSIGNLPQLTVTSPALLQASMGILRPLYTCYDVFNPQLWFQ